MIGMHLNRVGPAAKALAGTDSQDIVYG
jgi:hypothetical protein